MGAKRCTRYVRKGTLVTNGKAGKGSLFFSGNVRRKPLAPGSYRARLLAKTSAGLSAKESVVGFRVVRP